MYNQPVGPAAATGVGALAMFTMQEAMFWVLFAVAVFALIGAASAVFRTAPAIRSLYREPRRLAPQQPIR
ncbi:hypothetical protein B7Y94_00840 [Candidatus Saccharibacteria bacterium 32-49-12]|nr:MAG: hypothetical protein B7Y94_00840 [Candidatus Saccharibacteria bacterium 32-49-12]